MVDRAALGKTGAPFAMDIERGKIHELCRAVRASDPAYFAGQAPPVPPTFLTTMFFWEELTPGSNPWALVKMDQKRGMHAEQEYVFHGPPPRAGARLTCQSRISEIYEKEGRRGGTLVFAVMVTELRDEGGRLVAEARLTGVETGGNDGGLQQRQGALPPSVPSDGNGGPSGGDGRLSGGGQGSSTGARGWEELVEGAPGPEAMVLGPLTRTDFVRYQGASGDMNPIHHDETFARAAGYPAPLGIGMLPAGVMAAWAASWLGPENVRRIKVRWKEQVWPGDVLTISGKVARRYQEAGERRVDLDLLCSRHGGGTAVTGWATFVVPS